MGVRTELEPYLSTAIGSSVVSVMDIARGLSVIANGGELVEPRAVLEVADSSGGILFAQPVKRRRVLPRRVAQAMLYGLEHVVRRGTGTRARVAGLRVFGKTGTSSDYRDAWFAGATELYTCVVWLGNDDYSPTNRVYGGMFPAQIFRETMIALYKKDQNSQKH